MNHKIQQTQTQTPKFKTTKQERIAANKEAFDEILGDPFSTYDIIGQYHTFRQRSSIKAVDNSLMDQQGASGTTRNPARPNIIEFLCDVENAIEYGVTQYLRLHPELDNEVFWHNFFLTYITQEGEYIKQRDRAKIEQYIGRIFLARRISPVVKYFTAIRKRSR